MEATTKFEDTVKIMPGGAVILPGSIRKALRADEGNRIAFIVEGEEVRIVNPLIHAMREFQKAMEGEAERAGLYSDDDVVALIKEIRRERAQV